MAERFPHKFASAVGAALSGRCPDCERPISRVVDDYVLGLTEDRCIQLDSDGAYLMSNCSEFTLKLLRSRITKLEAVVAAAMELADALPYDAMVHRDVKPAFERLAAAKAELEREQGGGET